MNKCLQSSLSKSFKFFLLFLQPLYLLISILHHPLSILILSFLLTDQSRRQFSKRFDFIFLSSNFLFRILSIKGFYQLLTLLHMIVHFSCIFFNQIILLPNSFSFYTGFFSVDSFFVFSFYSVLSLLIVNLNIILYSLKNHLLIKILFSLSKRLIRVMLQLDSLPNTIQLKRLQSLFKGINFFITLRLIKFILFFI